MLSILCLASLILSTLGNCNHYYESTQKNRRNYSKSGGNVKDWAQLKEKKEIDPKTCSHIHSLPDFSSCLMHLPQQKSDKPNTPISPLYLNRMTECINKSKMEEEDKKVRSNKPTSVKPRWRYRIHFQGSATEKNRFQRFNRLDQIVRDTPEGLQFSIANDGGSQAI